MDGLGGESQRRVRRKSAREEEEARRRRGRSAALSGSSLSSQALSVREGEGRHEQAERAGTGTLGFASVVSFDR
jgi:hypothetical protein